MTRFIVVRMVVVSPHASADVELSTCCHTEMPSRGSSRPASALAPPHTDRASLRYSNVAYTSYGWHGAISGSCAGAYICSGAALRRMGVSSLGLPPGSVFGRLQQARRGIDTTSFIAACSPSRPFRHPHLDFDSGWTSIGPMHA